MLKRIVKIVALLGIGGIIGFVIGVNLMTAQKTPQIKETAQTIPVKVAPVERGSLAELFNTSGMVEARQSASLAPKISGRIGRVMVRLGDYVSAGQLLIELEKDDLLNNKKQAQAAYDQADTNYRINRDNLARMKKLFADGLIAQQQMETAQAQNDMAESQRNQARVGVELTDSMVKNAEIRAPINGYIGLCNANPGEVVNPGVPLVSIVDLSRIYVAITLSNNYISQIRRGQTAQVELGVPAQKQTGTVTEIAPAANPATKTFTVRIAIANPGYRFKEGMLADIQLNFNQRANILKIPMEAIIDDIGKKSVFVIKDNIAQRIEVVPGISDGKMVEIVSGLTSSDQVVVLGQNNLEEGSKVVVKK
jgi:RND family efflux transporter MFP subunit